VGEGLGVRAENYPKLTLQGIKFPADLQGIKFPADLQGIKFPAEIKKVKKNFPVVFHL
jgi:hypothetical protein